ncbi:DUF4365 domain-containing protein [Micromonospora sp. NPDC049114]|uniref:DUF4365 domain-containing protein n=1 Tax=unclassified Micromonospora TaxID=2617518 RepID=UPI0033D8FA31
MSTSSAQTERIGVATVDLVFSSRGWAFRPQELADHGIDAHAEVDGLTAPTGRFIAIQIKCGPSYFDRKTKDGWRFSATYRLLNYWLDYQLPVVLILVDPDTQLGYWVQVTAAAVRYTNRGWSIQVPSSNVLDARSDDILRGIALAAPPANLDPVEEALPLLPPSVVEMLIALRPVDPDGARRLAKLLSEGRQQPRSMVEALINGSRAWPISPPQLATIGAYANEHGHKDLALAAFALAAGRDPDNQPRFSGIAAIMAIAAGDKVRAADFLRPLRAREQAETDLLTDVAVCAFNADESGRDDVLTALLHDRPDEQLDAEPTCLLFLADRAFSRGNLDQALALYERVCGRHPTSLGGRLGRAQVLIERILDGSSVLPSRDQHEAVALATAVRDDIRRWAGPSETAHRLLVQERLIAGAFMEAIALATPVPFGGQANDREAMDPIVAVVGAQASIALNDRARAARFADAMRNTAAEPLIRALAADPGQPRATTDAMWRRALEHADTTLAARISLNHLASAGALNADDLDRVATLANLDADDRAIFTARNAAATGDLDAAVTTLQSQRSPAAGEVLIELLREAGRYDEALAACVDVWATYAAVKALIEKVNILALSGNLDAADASTAELLATGELAVEQRRQLHGRIIQRRIEQADWTGAEMCCRTALKDEPHNPDYGWGLITAQLNQDRWDDAWVSYRQLRPEVTDPATVPAWADLHLRFGITPETLAIATTLISRFEQSEPATLAHLTRVVNAPTMAGTSAAVPAPPRAGVTDG